MIMDIPFSIIRRSIYNVAKNNFVNHFAYENNESDLILNYISSCISPNDNLKLTSHFIIDEFKYTIFQMNSYKFPRPDDLNPTFYQKF